MFCCSWSGSKLFAKVSSRRKKSPLAGKSIINLWGKKCSFQGVQLGEFHWNEWNIKPDTVVRWKSRCAVPTLSRVNWQHIEKKYIIKNGWPFHIHTETEPKPNRKNKMPYTLWALSHMRRNRNRTPNRKRARIWFYFFRFRWPNFSKYDRNLHILNHVHCK